MRIYTPLFIALRVIIYSLLMFAVANAIYSDAAHPMGDSYFGEITMTEISQEIILFILFVFYLVFGYKYKPVQPVSNIVSLFFLVSFIREFNFLIDFWIYPVVLVFGIIAWLVIRDYRKIRQATIIFFGQPASAWFFSGFLVTYIFSRFFGKSAFWRLLYDENNYRLAKAAVEEGLELMGNTLMLIAAAEFIIFYLAEKKKEKA